MSESKTVSELQHELSIQERERDSILDSIRELRARARQLSLSNSQQPSPPIMPNRITKPKLKAAKKAHERARINAARKVELNAMRDKLAQAADGAPIPIFKPSVRERLFLKKLKKT